MGLNRLDEKLERYLDFKNGVFVEAGANNGIKQSNTYYLEAIKGWRGVLVEPVPHLYHECVKNRKSSKVLNAALVSREYVASTVQLMYADLMTLVKDQSDSEAHAARGVELQGLHESYDFEANAMTLDQVLEQSGFKTIDLLSLDVEGYECEALRGLDLSKWRPRYILVEVRDLDAVLCVLADRYRLLETLSDHKKHKDMLFVRND